MASFWCHYQITQTLLDLSKFLKTWDYLWKDRKVEKNINPNKRLRASHAFLHFSRVVPSTFVEMFCLTTAILSQHALGRKTIEILYVFAPSPWKSRKTIAPIFIFLAMTWHHTAKERGRHSIFSSLSYFFNKTLKRFPVVTSGHVARELSNFGTWAECTGHALITASISINVQCRRGGPSESNGRARAKYQCKIFPHDMNFYREGGVGGSSSPFTSQDSSRPPLIVEVLCTKITSQSDYKIYSPSVKYIHKIRLI